MYASFYIILFQTSTNKSHKNKQALKIDRTIRPQRPHDPDPATARCQIVLLHDAADTKTRCFASEKSLSFTKYLKIVSPQRIREPENTHFLELRKDRYRSNFADEKQ